MSLDGAISAHIETARAEGRAMVDLAAEVKVELMHDPDPDMIGPLCIELQAKAQKVRNHVDQAHELRALQEQQGGDE